MNMEKDNDNGIMTVLDAMERIMETGRGSGLSEEFFRNADAWIKVVSQRLSLTPVQSVLLSAFMNSSADNSIRVSDFADYFGCSTLRIIKYMKDIDVLEERKYIRCSNTKDRRTYRVPMEVVDALKEDRPYVPKSLKGITGDYLFCVLDDMFEALDDDEIKYGTFKQEMSAIFDDNPQLDFVRSVRKYDLDDDDLVMLLFICHRAVNEDDYSISWYDYRNVFKDKHIASYMKNTLRDGGNNLFMQGLIEHCTEDGVVDNTCVTLTDKARNELLGGMVRSAVRMNKDRNMLRHDKIAGRQLYYPKAVSRQVEELTGLLMPGAFDKVCERLAAKWMRKGFPCLFYGSPGTGKTETALQIAKATGRDIFQVDVSQLRSKWVGESEKNVKGLFECYRGMVGQGGAAPILLFNEADAILNKRKQGAEGGVDKMENALQNIILQEMESLEGIMIATTNLTGNMDSAFERRFLYKIEFERPSPEVRARIWRSMLQSVDETTALALAEDYDLSGGQIENIARKVSVSEVLYGSVSAERLREFCDQERLSSRTDSSSKRKIGF